jgi:hypothetical protein
VAKAGYIEVPTTIAELIYNVEGNGRWLGHEHHRWLCEIDQEANEIVFMHKPHSLHDNWRVRVLPRWREEMTLEDHLQYLFWEGTFSARERVVIGAYPLEELEAKVRERFAPTPREVAVKEALERARHLGALARRPLRRAAEQLLGRSRSG